MEANHQTIRLSRGKHDSPRYGACVMELASMLAGEDFTDRPKCVDPVVAAFLRAFNDRLDHLRRQQLFPYASAVVGTRTSRRATRRRRATCLAYASGHRHGGAFLRLKLFMLIGPLAAVHLDEGAGEWAAREAIRRDDVDGGFALLESLLEDNARGPASRATWRLEAPLEPAFLAPPVAREPELRVARAAADLVVKP
jgi:hypothetical protein